MNLRKSLFTGLAVLGLMVSAVAPIAAGPGDVPASVAEGGTFTFSLWGISFEGVAEVTATTGDVLTIPQQVLEINESRSSSPGWNLQVGATNFSDGAGHSIENKHLTVSPTANIYNTPCSGLNRTPNPTNPDQVVTVNTAGGTLQQNVQIVGATAGRGCGYFWVDLGYTLQVPAGTYTGGGTVTYTSNITVSKVIAPS